VTIGVFDGVHRGHQALTRETVKLARRLKAVPIAVTFKDHPVHILRGGERIPFLLDRSETFGLLKEAGIQRVAVIPFSRAFSKKDPGQFLDWLGHLGQLKGIVVGKDFRFGRGAAGDIVYLKRAGKERGFRVRPVAPVRHRGRIISSSRIRESLAVGHPDQAWAMLGRPYTIGGKVAHGRHMGHRIGFPTANLSGIASFLPKDGVYACAVPLGGKFYRAGMNLGHRPTFRDDDHHRQAEVHLLHYYGKLYGKKMEVQLLGYLRPERKFPSPTLLVRQIKKDLRKIQRTPLPRLK
jgi:riboflavin kinase/FMN adenylyltransferase